MGLRAAGKTSLDLKQPPSAAFLDAGGKDRSGGEAALSFKGCFVP